jgi:hypothetical protein
VCPPLFEVEAAAYRRGMDATSVSGGATGADPRSGFGAGQLFLTDSRVALGVANYARHRAMHRVFGVDRQQANLLTAVLVLTAGAPTAAALWRTVRAPLAVVTGVNAGIGAFALGQVTRGVVGPGVREVPDAAALLALAVVGGLALPQLRRAARGVRQAEHRVRMQRESMYGAARAAARRA